MAGVTAKDIKVVLKPGEGINGTIAFGEKKFIWYINRDYRFIIEGENRDGDLPLELYPALDELLEKGDPTIWQSKRIPGRYGTELENPNK